MSGDSEIRPAVDADAPRLVDTLARAFADDPALGWIIPDAAARQRRLPRLFRWLFADHRRHGMMLTSGGGEVATFWRLPGKVHHHDPLTPAELARLVAIFGPHLLRAERVGRHLARHVPAGEDHLYLRYAGVRPEAQGRGWGGRAIRAGIAEANRRGVDTCLETAKPANVGLYQRLGFAIVDAWDVPGGGPRFWTMVRPRDRS